MTDTPATVAITVHAPNPEAADRWADTIASLVRAEHGDHMRLNIRRVPSVPADQTELRDRIADAVLAVLLGPIPSGTDVPSWTAIRAIQLMNEAGEQTEAYRLALSTALGLGTGANWEAIRDRAEDLAAEVEGMRAELAKLIGWHREDGGALGEMRGTIQRRRAELKRVRDLHRETCILARGEVKPTAFKCGMCEVLDAPADGPGRVPDETQQPVRPRCPHCQLPHDLEPGSLPVAVCESTRRRIAEAERLHAEGEHRLCCRADCDVLRQRDDEMQQPETQAQRCGHNDIAWGLCTLPSSHDGDCLHEHQPRCGAWGGCTLRSGHNIGQADIPENHHTPAAVVLPAKEA